MAPSTPTPGFYGKLVSTGDFVRRAFPAEVYECWDPWLQQGLLSSRAALAETWLDAYLSAPIWRFALSPGIAGDRLWIGAMMPSVDRVGRYFPITVVAAAPADTDLFSAAHAAQPWLEQIEGALLETLDGDGVSADMLAERIADAEPPFAGASERAATEVVEPDEGSIGIRTSADLEIDSLARPLAAGLAARLLGEPLSLWWSSGSNLVAAGARLHRGLPVDAGFAHLLCDGPLSSEPTAHVR